MFLFIACFDWKIGIFQQMVVRVYYILKCLALLMTHHEKTRLKALL